jgi:hypothetical protein
MLAQPRDRAIRFPSHVLKQFQRMTLPAKWC